MLILFKANVKSLGAIALKLGFRWQQVELNHLGRMILNLALLARHWERGAMAKPH